MGTGAGQILVALGMSHTEVQHLIEKCLLFNMTKEECMEALSKHADIKPVITSTVWKELEKENKEFFEAYAKTNKEDIGIMSERETTEKIRKILSSSSPSSSSTPSSPRLRSSSVAGLQQHHDRENDEG